ncbi:hypothetical protein JTB14_001611 [Gonioctena quinquepunctata]|nr:hypothetical protein JTB14_001611 [Gonioctena quinquepunctata]
MSKHKFKAEQIYNLDETGITTVSNPQKIVSGEGKNQHYTPYFEVQDLFEENGDIRRKEVNVDANNVCDNDTDSTEDNQGNHESDMVVDRGMCDNDNQEKNYLSNMVVTREEPHKGCAIRTPSHPYFTNHISIIRR